LPKCWKRKVNKQSGGRKSPPLLCVMGKKILSSEEQILAVLSDAIYSTRKRIHAAVNLTTRCIDEHLREMVAQGLIETIDVRTTQSTSRAEIAYIKVVE
jgi:predicted transcriptional regulator